MPDQVRQQAAAQLQKDWDIALQENISEEAILALLAYRIIQLLERGGETFFQLMYRLDIPEQKLNAVLRDSEAPLKIAKLVYDRQLQKIQSRAYFKDHPLSAEDDLKW